MLGCVLYKGPQAEKTEIECHGIVVDASILSAIRLTPALVVLSSALLLLCLLLNLQWW
jgi:hypothetical protein